MIRQEVRPNCSGWIHTRSGEGTEEKSEKCYRAPNPYRNGDDRRCFSYDEENTEHEEKSNEHFNPYKLCKAYVFSRVGWPSTP